jgi:curved DNA-binding protein CbpA
MPLPENAVNPDEFLDYYQLLDQPDTATTAEVRGRINDLYAEAQANRDHRNPQKRREYQLWLDLLPQARSVLTDEAKRAKYDDYRRNLQSGASVPPYADFLRELEGKPAPSQEQASVLGLREEAKPTETAPKPPPRPVSSGSGGGASPTAGIAAIVALVVIAGIGAAMGKLAIGLVAGAVIAAVVFMAMRGGNKVAR